MLIILFFMVLIPTILLTVVRKRDRFWDLDNTIFSIIFGSLVGILIGFIISFTLPMDMYEKHWTNNIECLKDNGSVSGRYFLGSGNINGKMVYVYYVQDGEYYKMGMVEHWQAKIKYGTDKPVIHTYKKSMVENSWVNLFAFDNDLGQERYVFEVPKGTITNEYKLDAQ